MGHQAYLKSYTNFNKKPLLSILRVINLAIQHSCRYHYMIQLSKITIKYNKWAYTTDTHNLVIGVPLLQESDDNIVIHTLTRSS